MAQDKASGMKSSYELALERMASAGIEPPREEAYSLAVREALAEARRVAEAKLAEIEILHKDKLKSLADPLQRAELEELHRIDRRRIESDRDAKLDRLRKEVS